MNAPMLQAHTRLTELDFYDPTQVSRVEAFVRDHGGTPFHRPLWLKAIEQGTGSSAYGLLLECGGAIAAWLPLTLVHSAVFGRALVSSGFAVEGGALANREEDAVALCQAAEELAMRLSVPGIEVRGGAVPHAWASTDTSHCGFTAALAHDDDAQLLVIPRKARAEIRKGLKNDLSVRVGTDAQARAHHYGVYAESVRNLGTPVFPRSLFESVMDAFGENADILTIVHDRRPVSSVLSLYHGGTVMPYWGGGRWEARSLRANERMYYALMCHARERGCTLFDFGRSKTGSGPYHFKKNWGFEPQPLTYSNWSADPSKVRNIDPTDGTYARRIELWQKLPLAIANRIGPFIARGLG